MSSRQRRVWWTFAGCTAGGLAVLVWLGVAILRLERDGLAARAEAAHRGLRGAALWRMDTWLASLLAPESARPWQDYQAFSSQTEAYTNTLSKLDPDAVVTPSPLLAFRSDLIPLHFQVGVDGKVSSPQVPRGNQLDLTQSINPGLEVGDKARLLGEIEPRLSVDRLLLGCRLVASNLPDLNPLAAQEAEKRGTPPQGWHEFASRAQTTKLARQGVFNEPSTLAVATVVGPLLPLWLDGNGAGDRLVYVRSVRRGGTTFFQGFLVDWPRLQQELLAQVADLALGVPTLRRVDPSHPEVEGRMLATVPAALDAPPPPPDLPAWSATRTTLALAAGAALLVVLVIAVMLRAALAFGERRARFASSVTHELRTPLTTFRMYSEMLAKDMVSDPARRKDYLVTLQREADRLSRLVENVLGYARIEDGRFTARRETMSAAALLERVRPPLAQRVADAGGELQVGEAPDVTVTTDVDAVGQILFNLVENACKYGAGPFELGIAAKDGGLALTVRDHGPGIPAALRRRVFAPFDRGRIAPGDNQTPGIGLGLALSRRLARDLGGDLWLEDAAPGARLVLTLPG